MIGQLAAVAAGCVAYGTFVEAKDYRIRRFLVPVLPEGAPRVRVLHVSDIHLMARQRSKRGFLAALSGLEPDLVVNTGDNIAQAKAITPLLDAFGRLLDRPGVFVFGSNDYTAPTMRNPLSYLASPSDPDARKDNVELPWTDLRDRLTERGWHDLNHRRVTLEIEGLRIELRGTDDGHLNRDDYSLVAGPPASGTDLSIGVTHAPYRRLLNVMTRDGVQLILAGHTHGGQVCIPGKGALVTNCDLDRARVKGLSRNRAGGNQSLLHVSAGLGSSPFAPYRFACRPEVSLLTLIPAA